MKSASKLISADYAPQAAAVLSRVHHKGTKDTKVLSTSDDAVNSHAEHLDVEVDDDSEIEVQKPKIGKNLRSMDRKDPSHRLYFQDDQITYYQIQAIATVHVQATIMKREDHLPLVINSSQGELSAKAFLVG